MLKKKKDKYMVLGSRTTATGENKYKLFVTVDTKKEAFDFMYRLDDMVDHNQEYSDEYCAHCYIGVARINEEGKLTKWYDPRYFKTASGKRSLREALEVLQVGCLAALNAYIYA